jgi:D-threo-aldose 1-dehydrogenase
LLSEATRKIGPLGYGTSAFGGRTGRKESLRLLEVAFDAGIRHFDTAPMYGYGAAEEVLGEFLRNKRDKVTITTKLGIEPPKRSALLSAAKTLAKTAISIVPSLRSKVAQRAGAMVSRGNFNLPYAAMSLRRSLTALNTTHIDIFLMHEVTLEQISPELIDFLEIAMQKGEIGSYGPASSSKQTSEILESGKAFGNVVQIPETIFEHTKKLLPESGLCIVHSIFGEKFRAFTAAIAQDKNLANQCSQLLGFDSSDTAPLGRLFLWNVLQRNRSGTVLFSSLNPNSIRKNAALLNQPEFSVSQSEALNSLLSSWRASALS